MNACEHCLDPQASEDWRHTTEVRYVAALTVEARTEYLVGVRAARGEAAWKRLREDARRLVEQRRAVA